jgi:hypothetical protein
MPERAALMTALMLDRHTCSECIADKALLSVERAQKSLEAIAEGVKLYREPAQCGVCGETKPTYSIERPQFGARYPLPRRPPQIRAAVLAFLADHRGDVFCSWCVAVAIKASRVDMTLREAEGYGAPRRHGECSRCGKLGLVSGLTGEAERNAIERLFPED